MAAQIRLRTTRPAIAYKTHFLSGLVHKHAFGSLFVQRGENVDLRHEGIHVVEIHVARRVLELAELFGGPEQDALRVVVRHAHAAEGRADDHVDHAVLVGAEKLLFGDSAGREYDTLRHGISAGGAAAGDVAEPPRCGFIGKESSEA